MSETPPNCPHCGSPMRYGWPGFRCLNRACGYVEDLRLPDDVVEEEQETYEFRVTARNVHAYYEMGTIKARDEHEAIRIAKVRCGCADGLVFAARWIGGNR